MLELRVDKLGEMKKIQFNYEEIKKGILAKTEVYKKMVYTNDNIKEAKNDRASLNKLAKTINDKRIEVEKEFMLPFNEFKAQMTELVEIIKEPVMTIDKQVKEYEAQQKEEKKKKILELFLELVKDTAAADVLDIQTIWNEKWLNVTYTMKAITEEITEAKNNLITNFKIIEEQKTEFENQMKDVYLKTGSLAKAMQERTRLQEQKQKLEAQKAAAAQKAAEKAMSAPAPTTATAMQQAQTATGPEAKPATRKVEFWVEGTQDDFNKLKEFLISNNIKFGGKK